VGWFLVGSLRTALCGFVPHVSGDPDLIQSSPHQAYYRISIDSKKWWAWGLAAHRWKSRAHKIEGTAGTRLLSLSTPEAGSSLPQFISTQSSQKHSRRRDPAPLRRYYDHGGRAQPLWERTRSSTCSRLRALVLSDPRLEPG